MRTVDTAGPIKAVSASPFAQSTRTSLGELTQFEWRQFREQAELRGWCGECDYLPGFTLQRSKTMKADASLPTSSGSSPMIHPTACVDQPCQIGAGTNIWHYSHIMAGAVLGTGCNIGQNVFIASGVRLGNNVKVQNNVSLYEGCILEDDVFCGPSAVFTNVRTPRSAIVRKGQYGQTYVERGVTIGANSTLIAPIRVGHDAFISAGAVATKDVVPYALMMGVPARRVGWVGRAGVPLVPYAQGGADTWICPETAEHYRQLSADCLEPDRAEDCQSES